MVGGDFFCVCVHIFRNVSSNDGKITTLWSVGGISWVRRQLLFYKVYFGEKQLSLPSEFKAQPKESLRLCFLVTVFDFDDSIANTLGGNYKGFHLIHFVKL